MCNSPLLFLQYPLTLEDADQHNDDQCGNTDADEDVYVFQRNLAELLIEILKGVQLAVIRAGIGLLRFRGVFFFFHITSCPGTCAGQGQRR